MTTGADEVSSSAAAPNVAGDTADASDVGGTESEADRESPAGDASITCTKNYDQRRRGKIHSEGLL